MKNKIDVSVIIPAYNAAETIVSLVNKIFSENSVAIELIVIDDGSTDGTANILRQIHDERLILIKKANQDVYAARKVLCLSWTCVSVHTQNMFIAVSVSITRSH
ncbi:TPA: glycosyltransferase [Klebsiella aerogenes]|nr:glycosyltransferase [Klebsiella aerogenes]